MSSTILLPPAAPPPGPKRWTAAEFHQIGDTGVFESKNVKMTPATSICPLTFTAIAHGLVAFNVPEKIPPV